MPDSSPPLPGPFLRTDATNLGVAERRLKSRAFRTVFTGVVVDARIPDTVVVRSRAAMLACPEGGVISHWTAARLWGGVVPDNEWTHISFMRDVRFRLGGVKPHRFRHRLDIKRRHGLPVTSPAQTFCHLAKHLGLVDLVALGDRLVKKGRCTPSELVDYAESWPGQCREEARRAAQLVRDRVDSVPETALRLLMVLAGLPEPQVDIHIRDDDGRVRFRIELGYEGALLAIEYDGRWHDAPEQREHDETRRSGLSTREGWTFVVVKTEELYDFPEQLLERLAAELRAHGIQVPAVLSDDWRRHFRVVTAAA
jgi:hypothetical protein